MKFFSMQFCVEMGKISLTVWAGFWSISKRGWVWKRFGNMRFDHLDHCDRSNHQAGRSYHLPKTKFMLKCIFSAVGPTWKGTLKNVLYMIKWHGSQWNTRGLKGFIENRRCAAFLFRHGPTFLTSIIITAFQTYDQFTWQFKKAQFSEGAKIGCTFGQARRR